MSLPRRDQERRNNSPALRALLTSVGCCVAYSIACFWINKIAPGAMPWDALDAGFVTITMVTLAFIGDRLAKTKFSYEAFRDCNHRYDRLKDELRGIGDQREYLDGSAKKTLRCYFDLCAEEYWLKTQGLIPDVVWEAWSNGMQQYAKHDHIREFWLKELNSNSYYGFPRCLVEGDKAHSQKSVPKLAA
jgi:hypothetical protein